MFAAGIALFLGTCFAANEPVPELTVPPIQGQPPYLDGTLTDECWQAAAVISNFPVFKKPGETVGHKAWLTRDGQWLYVAIEILHPAPKHIKQTVFESDGSVISDDSIEVYLDPGSSNAFYMYYALNAANIKSDQVVLRDGSRDRQAQMPWRSATRLTDKGWNAELAFPLHILLAGTRFQKTINMKICDWTQARINICVNTVKPLFDPYGARMSEERQNATWSPVVSGYHEPDRFGMLKGISPDPTTTPASKTTAPLFWPMLVNAQAGHYEIKAGQPGYNLNVTVKNTTYSPGKVEVVAVDRPVAGAAGEMRQNQAMGAGKEEHVVLTIPLKTPGQRTVMVWLNDTACGGAFESRLLDEQTMQATDPFAAWFDRSYYTTEKEALAVCRLRVPASSLAGQSVVVKDKDGKTVGRMERLAADCRVPVALDQFTVGRHPLTIEWLGADGKPQAVQKSELIKLEPRPGCEVKLDKVNGALIKDGNPIFPFGLCVNDWTSQDEPYLKRYAETGYNALLWACPVNTSPDEMKNRLETAQRYGLMVIEWVAGIVPITPNNSGLRKFYGLKVYDKKGFTKEEEIQIALEDFEQFLPGLRKRWEISSRAPNLIAYYGADEPNLLNPDARLAVTERFYRELKLMDAYRPALVVYSGSIPPGARWTDWSEILAFDPYIYCGWRAFDHGTPNFVSKQTIELKRRADSVQQAVWIIPIASQVDPARSPRSITPAEQNCQTYLALIHGAKGLLYFANTALSTQIGWDTLSLLAQQMKVLGPAVASPGVPQELTYTPTPLDADKGVFPEVQSALFRHPDGRYILLAANGASYPVTATFTIPGLQEQKENAVKDLFGNKSYPVKDYAFNDELEGYGVRAYVLEMKNEECRMQNDNPNNQSKIENRHVGGFTAKWSLARNEQRATGKIQIAVLSQGHPEKGTPEKAFPIIEIKKRKNVMPNPSLEITTISGMPDYVRPNMYMDWPLVGAPGTWGMDTNNPWHGKQCLRLMHRFKGGEPPDMNHRITMGVFYAPNLTKPTTYTFSLYARAAKNGDELSVNVGSMQPSSSGKWKLTTEWQRYSFTGKLSAGPGSWPGGNRTFGLYTFSKDAVVWVDALQMEQGETPTAFTME